MSRLPFAGGSGALAADASWFPWEPGANQQGGIVQQRPRRRPRLDPSLLGGDLAEVLQRLEGALSDLAGGEGAPDGFDPRRYLAPGVPRIRPLLVLLSARAVDGDAVPPDSATEHVAVAAELLHLAIVLHDAALGRPGGRRRRAARRLLSGAVGVLAGNHLTLRALELTRHTPAPEIVGDLLDAMREVSDGHALAQRCKGRLPTAAEAQILAEARSGAVFAFACRAGGRLAGADRRSVTALGRYGRHAGVAWHLAEDLASLEEGDEPTDPSGNTLDDRAIEGRPSHSLCLAAERTPGLVDAWEELGRDPTPEGARALAARIQQTGSPGETRMLLAQESWAARRALRQLRPSRYRDLLDQIAIMVATEGRDQPSGQP